MGISPALDRRDQFEDVFHRRLRQHAVAQVEDVAGAAGGLREHVERAAADRLAIGEQHRRLEVPCTARSWPTIRQPSARPIRQSMPITDPPASRNSGRRAGLPVVK
jgi:hypothetical protein